jgi:FMN phosphatase YigB (HAD superfamily)
MTNVEAPRYETVFFDLDGTLLPIDMDAFLSAYFKRLGCFIAERGFDSEKIIAAVNAGVKSMLSCDPRLNKECFWETFEQMSGKDREIFDPLLMEFYSTAFNELGDMVTPNPAAVQIIEVLKQKGYQLFLTTMPLFPRIAVEARLRWAGIEDASVFDRITTYDNSHAAKPHHAYFQENIDLAKGDAAHTLMVGNNTREDLACCDLGADGFLVTDWLLDPIGLDYSNMKHGSLEDLLAFVETLPECD